MVDKTVAVIIWNDQSFPTEVAVKKDAVTINVTPELPLIRLLDMVRKQGAIRLAHGEDMFVISRDTPRLPESAREFLKNGGVIGSE
jgi:hypothetical protein